jgi:hypothetical protein
MHLVMLSILATQLRLCLACGDMRTVLPPVPLCPYSSRASTYARPPHCSCTLRHMCICAHATAHAPAPNQLLVQCAMYALRPRSCCALRTTNCSCHAPRFPEFPQSNCLCALCAGCVAPAQPKCPYILHAVRLALTQPDRPCTLRLLIPFFHAPRFSRLPNPIVHARWALCSYTTRYPMRLLTPPALCPMRAYSVFHAAGLVPKCFGIYNTNSLKTQS